MTVSGANGCDTPQALRADISREVFDIAARLGESDFAVVQQIWRIVSFLGIAEAWRFVVATEVVEAEGGMRVPDGTRRRTKGGVFFTLVKAHLAPDVRAALLPNARERKVARETGDRGVALDVIPPGALRVPNAWMVRAVVIASAHQQPGELLMIAATLYGRPGAVIEHPNYVAFELIPVDLKGEAKRPFPELAQLPQPSEIPPVPYLVYALPKHWRRVAQVVQDPEDQLIIEVAYMAWDEMNRRMIVWAKLLASKAQRKAKERALRRPRGPEHEPGK